MDPGALSINKTVIIVRFVAELLSEFLEGFFGRLSYKTCVSGSFLTKIWLAAYKHLLQIFFCIMFVFRNVGRP